ncbi:MAG: hypothetical protein LBD52_08550 [Prevotellaceae bacterium]|jgi:hypothetical protein|nr:hypothetical protein [Prevotellaceae bacterium]
MKTIRIFIFILPVLFSSFAKLQAQDKDNSKINNFKLGLEAGFNSYWGEVAKPEHVRENYSSPYSYSFHILPTQSAMVYHLGFKPEYFFLRNRFGISAGLRVSRFSSAFESGNSYPVMWLLRQEDIHTEYVRIRSITQNSYYVGIPLEIRFFPNRREFRFQHYLKLGVALNCHVHTKYKTVFYDEHMHIHAGTVEAQLGKPYSFNSYIYPAIGFKIGRSPSPWVNLEIYCSALITPRTISFMKNGAGVGCQFSVQLPVGKSAPVGSSK